MPNSLIHASSPYLLQHANNPVDWLEWNQEVIENAKQRNKLIIISIGYAACHWCHVMEHESFESNEVADVMNQFFISVKVDREERPDIDAVYMNACQLTTGRGGWPLNVIALPNGKPIFAGTYFPKQHWIQLLFHFQKLWKENPEQCIDVASRIEDGLNQMENEFAKFSSKEEHFAIDKITNSIIDYIDFKHGGLDKAPKFPMPIIYQYLLNHYLHFHSDASLKAIHTTLINMMEGGIYDQVGGGFARYSVDEFWFVPHFEKMLYDNSQLISLYARVYAITGIADYKKIAKECIQFTKEELLDSSGLYYSSLDADSEGVEGKYYCWSIEEINQLVSYRSDIVIDYYFIQNKGNWEHTNILYIKYTFKELATKYNLPEEEIEKIILDAKSVLKKYRKSRIKPGLDDKCITSWNAMMLKALIDYYKISFDSQILEEVIKMMQFMDSKLIDENGLYYRNYKNEKVSITGFLDDQMIMIDAKIHLYQITFEESYLLDAKDLMEKCVRHFFDSDTNMFFYTTTYQLQPVLRTKEINDNVIASSNSIAAMNLYYLGHYFDHDNWINLSKKMCQAIHSLALKSGPYFSHWTKVMLAHQKSGIQIAVCGDLKPEEWARLYKNDTYIIMKYKENSIVPLLFEKGHSVNLNIYVCQDKSCSLPINSFVELEKHLDSILS